MNIGQLDIITTAAINGLAGAAASLDGLMEAISAYGVPVLVALVVLQWWWRQDCPSSSGSG